ncbi:MAG: malto-oligosyltrehalose synthase [Nibricoccus sp.]
MPRLETSHVPKCTYRVQLNGRFTFNDLGALVPYFTELGISDLYLSPVFTATPGSTHGYDVTDYLNINPDIGGGDGFDILVKKLKTAGCEIILDFVPNHMGIAGVLNKWWFDVLENGRMSPYARFFDIRWNSGTSHGRPRVLVPLLEDHYGKVLERGKIALVYDNGFTLRYGEVALPIRPGSYSGILDSLVPPEQPGAAEIHAILMELADLPRLDDAPPVEVTTQRSEAVERLKKELVEVIAAHPDIKRKLDERLETINGKPGDPASYDELHALLEKQHYRLARWKTGAHEINYRRFFAIDTLVGLRMERNDVFRECHGLLARLVREGKVAGLRIDHIDGLRQPEDYLQRLQTFDRPDASRPLYVVVEKILAQNETLPDRWMTHGTTGYEFIAQLAQVLVNPDTEAKLDDIYQRFTGDKKTFEEIVYRKKKLIISELFLNAVSNLGSELVEILSGDRYWKDLTRQEITSVVEEFMANLSVYRTYRRRQQTASAADCAVLEEMCAKSLARSPRADPQPFEFVRDLLVGVYPPANADEDFRDALLSWVLTFQQYTGAVMAKAVEDTAFYNYNRLIALNEVGGNPGLRKGTIEGFHRANQQRLANFPYSMLTTSTHDTKLSEDVRARLYGLSELVEEWAGWVVEWDALTKQHITQLDGEAAPDAQDRYRFFQILLGVWPLDENEVGPALQQRLREHFRKAVSEAKSHTSILQANEAYFAACEKYCDAVSSPAASPEFYTSFLPAAARIARLGMVNSLTQLVLKCTVPGVPDFYQGNEIWDFSLVDPDNRREVNFALRQRLLEQVTDMPLVSLVENWRDGRVKMRTMQLLLKLRQRRPELFATGDYQPLEAEGLHKDHVIAFRRNLKDAAVLVVVPRLTAKIGAPPLGLIWDDTRLPPQNGIGQWRDIFADRTFPSAEPLNLRSLCAELPFAVLEGTNKKE